MEELGKIMWIEDEEYGWLPGRIKLKISTERISIKNNNNKQN